jgi:hypothetical protein
MKEYIKKKLEQLAKTERKFKVDCFPFVQAEINIYRDNFGVDNWLNNYIFEYNRSRETRKI